MHSLPSRARRRAAARPLSPFLLPLLAALGVACGDDGTASRDGTGPALGGSAGSSGSTSTSGAGGSAGEGAEPNPLPAVTRVDLLLMLDNSISMVDKHALLQAAVPELVTRLVDPGCIDASGNVGPAPAAAQSCPEGQRREFAPLSSLHVGVITSSLGDAAANEACPTDTEHEKYREERADMAHLLGSLPRAASVDTNEQGFLAWEPGMGPSAFSSRFQRLIATAGGNGCGWEHSLESWYRFLIDPAPYVRRVAGECPEAEGSSCNVPLADENGKPLVDDTLLGQRRAFLRDDSLLLIVMLSDEDDCSLSIGDSRHAAFQYSAPFARAATVCADDPSDRCCYSCATQAPAGCNPDPSCEPSEENPTSTLLAREQDAPNLRCFDQKRRFGMDLLYPTARYQNALAEPELCLEHPDLSVENCPEALIVNPLFAGGRDPSRVFLAGILGVPWQHLAADSDRAGNPMLASSLRFKSSGELRSEGDWSRILGTLGTAFREASDGVPERQGIPSIAPASPFMISSSAEREGVTMANPINGREYDTTVAWAGLGPNDLQHACLFPLPEPRDCSSLDPETESCDCFEGENNLPQCEREPGLSAFGTTQYWAKAYPASRQLDVLRLRGDAGIVTSICSREVVDATRPDFGYRPAVNAILERIQPSLAGE